MALCPPWHVPRRFRPKSSIDGFKVLVDICDVIHDVIPIWSLDNHVLDVQLVCDSDFLGGIKCHLEKPKKQINNGAPMFPVPRVLPPINNDNYLKVGPFLAFIGV